MFIQKASLAIWADFESILLPFKNKPNLNIKSLKYQQQKAYRAYYNVKFA